MNERRQDFELLQRFTHDGEQSAFADVVRRHLDLVFATALRKVEDAGAARKSPRMCLLPWRARRGGSRPTIPAAAFDESEHRRLLQIGPCHPTRLRQPTPDGARSSAFAVHAIGPTGLSSIVMSRTSKNILVAVPVILLLLAIVIPNFMKAHTTLSPSVCRNNLQWIEAAKKQWALEGHTAHEIPKEADLLRYLVSHNPADHQMSPSFPRCPSGGTYTIGALNELPKCSIGGDANALPQIGTFP